jgi:flagellar biosynthesis chaperone FliJ
MIHRPHCHRPCRSCTNTNSHTSHNVARSTNYHHYRPNTTAVVYSPRNAFNWTQCKNRLHTLLQQCNNNDNGIDGTDHDPVMDDIATISTHSMMKRTVLDEPLSSKLQHADEIVSSMESDIQRIMQQVQNVSTLVSSLQSQYDTLQTYFTTTQHEIEKVLQPQQQHHQQQIQQYHNAIAQYEHDIQSAKQHNYQTVPRLQQNISLYVSMTGIKWKYDDVGDDVLNHQEDGKVVLTGEIVSTVYFYMEVL